MRLTALALFVGVSLFALGCSLDPSPAQSLERPKSTTPLADLGAPGSDASADTETQGAADAPSKASRAKTAAKGDKGPKGAEPLAPVTPPAKEPPAPVPPKIACATDVDSVTESYRIALRREPDPAGLAHWVNLLESDDGATTRLGILHQFVDAQEFLDVNANLTDAEYVGRLYTEVLFREPDVDGATVWVNALASGESRAAVAHAFIDSAEFADPNANPVAACYF